MRSGHISPVLMALACLAALLGGSRRANAFDDDACIQTVPSQQHLTLELRPGEPVDMARNRAINELEKLAVLEVVGVDVESSGADETKLENESNTSHASGPAVPAAGGSAEDRAGVASRYQDAIRSSYRGLVRVKLTRNEQTGISPHQTLDIAAVVTVCQPKPEAIVALQSAKAARDRVPPRVIDPDTAVWFDPTTGEPQVWYWSGPNDTYTFFDKSGFDPMTGEPLKLADRPFLKSWKVLRDKRKKDAEYLAVAQEKQAALQKKKEDTERSQAEQRAAQEVRTLQACDDEAANPNDPRKPNAVSGVKWDDLKAVVASAIRDCEASVRLRPAELRFRYELARAYSIGDPKRALPMFKKLMEERYPAAYDNYGWALADRRVGREDLTGATRAFEAGVRADDSDAMVSLAGFMTRGVVEPNTPDEPLQLYRRAAGLGNSDAVAAVAALEAERAQADAARIKEAEQARQQAIQQEQAARMMIGILGAVRR